MDDPTIAEITCEEIIDLLMNYQIPHSTEAEMQQSIAKIFTKNKVEFEREKRLSKKDVVDFLVSGIAIECKTKGQPLAIHRQLERYAKHKEVEGIILYTSIHMNVKEEIEGKPAFSIKCGLSWL